MNIITSYDINEVYSRIKIKKPIKFNNKIILNLYDEYQDCLLFQSPTMYLPYDFIHNDSVIKCIDLCEYNDNKFINFITILYKKIITKIENFDKKLFQNKEFLSNIIKKNDNIMFRLKEVYFSRLNIYDTNNRLIDINKIVKETKIKCIFMIKNIWINDNKYGFNLQLLQIQYKDFMNNENLFKNSCNSDNEWTNVIIEKDLSLPAPPPPPPPPPPINISKNNIRSGKKDLNEIIKERKNNNKNKKEEKKIEKATMADVLNQLKSGEIKLKPTVINNKSNKDNLMCEMEKVLKRRMSLRDGQ